MCRKLVKLFGPRRTLRCLRSAAMRRNLSIVFGRNVRKTPAKTLWVPIPIFCLRSSNGRE